MRKLLLLGCAGFVSIACRSARAQGTPAAEATDTATAHSYRFRLLGVYDERTGEPIVGAEVRDMTDGSSSLTSSTGTVSLVFLPDGGSLVSIRKIGYAARTLLVAISPTDTMPVTVTMTHVTELQTVTVKGTRYLSPALRGFEDRRLHGATGYFVTDSVLRKSEGHTLANVLIAKIPGVKISQQGHASYLMRSPRCSNGGPPDVYVDGVPLVREPPLAAILKNHGKPTQTVYPIDLSQVDVSELSGVEYYPDGASLPIQFSHTTQGCGALLLWTRE